MSLAGSPWWVIAQGVLLAAIALNVMTFQDYRLGMALALASIALVLPPPSAHVRSAKAAQPSPSPAALATATQARLLRRSQ
jgi:hypothetical protein